MNNKTTENTTVGSTDVGIVEDVVGTKSDSNIKVFESSEFGSIRMVEIDGEPYFVGKDVADILGYINSRKALIDHVDEEDKNTVTIRDGIPGNPNQVVINESGLYSLILSSKLPKAKEFKHWVTSEVLPSIRKTGSYIAEDSDTQRYIQNLQDTVTEYYLTMIQMQKELHLLASKKPVDLKAINTWKKYIATRKVEEFSELSGIEMPDCYKIIYDVMADDYGFCEPVAIMDFQNKFECDNISTITIIANDNVYRQQFIQSANKLINSIKPTAIPIVEVNPQSAPVVKESSPKSKFEGREITVEDSFDDIINYIAELRGDTTKTKLATKRFIFPQITTYKGWRIALTRNHCTNKKDLIISNLKYKKRFVKVCNEIVKEMMTETVST